MSLNIAERQPLLHRNPNRNQRSVRSAPQSTSPISPTTPDNNSNRRSVCRTRVASAAILLSLVFERIAFYGLAGNLVLFLNEAPFEWESYHAVDASLYFFGLCFATSLVGGWLADSFLGRFKAIVISFVIYLAGYVFMPLMSPKTDGKIWDQNKTVSLPGIRKIASDHDGGDDMDTDPFDEQCAWLVYTALLVIAVGTGFVKANIAPFGSDQVAGEGQQATLSFFNWFYWSINLGALLGLSVITYLQQQQSFFVGYLASACCLGMSLLLFVAGRCFYNVRPPDGSVLSNIFRIIHEAYRQKRRRQQAVKRRATNVLRGNSSREIDEAEPVEARLNFLDYAKHRYGGIFHDSIVEDVRQLKKIFAVFAVLIPYWLVYFQMQTTFLIQGLHMRLMMSSKAQADNVSQTSPDSSENVVNLQNSSTVKDHPQLVAAWFALFDVIILVFLLPLFDRVIYPWIERRSGSPVSISWRILVGMVFAAAAMLVAGVLEHYRLKVFWPYPDEPCRNASFDQVIGFSKFQAANLSILWQIPQYALIGLSEVFTSVAGLQFAVSVAPRSMKGIIMGLFYLFSGIGSFLGTTVIISLNSSNVWFHAHDYGNINCRLPCTPEQNYVNQSCHLDYYFFLLAGIEVFGAFLFLLVAKVYRLDELHRQSRNPRPVADASEENRLLSPQPNDPFQPRSIQHHRSGRIAS